MISRRLELLAIFGLGPLAVRAWCPSWAFLPLLAIVAAASVATLYRDTTFLRQRFRLVWTDLSRPALRRLALRGVLAAGVIATIVRLAFPDRWFDLPREHVVAWLVIVVLYPVVSVVPQELVFRVFFFHRYRAVLGEKWLAIAVGALAFGWVHVVFGNWLAVVLSALGGGLLADTYRRTRSLTLVSLEHALYGQLLFTIGLGEFFYHGRVG